MKQKKDGITLIALVITIIVLIILAGISIQLLLGENGIIAKAKKGKGDYGEASVREKVEMALVEYNSNKLIEGEEGEIEEALNKLFDNNTFDDIEIEENIGMIDDYEITLGKEKGEVIIDSIDKVTGSLRLRCKVSTKEYTKDSITIHVKASGNIAKLIKPDNKEVTPINGKIEIDYPVNENGTYIFKAEDTEGIPLEKPVTVDNIDTLAPQDFTITAQQVDKKIVITANTEDTIDETGKSACSGIGRYEYFIKKLTDTNYLETPYTTNEIEITEYGIYKIFVKAYDRAGNPKDCKEEITIEIINPKVSKYGQKVNYNVNGIDDWKIFYINEEKNETFIITSDYLPNKKIPSETGLQTNGTYIVYSTNASYSSITKSVRDTFMIKWNKSTTNGNIKFVSQLLDTAKWNSFVREDLQEKGVTAIGSPTLEMWVASWNERYPDNSLTCNTSNNDGYYLGSFSDSETSTNSVYGLVYETEGYKNKLYFPYTSTLVDKCDGYWLSAPFASHSNNPVQVSAWGGSINDACHFGVRPVVALPNNVNIIYNKTTGLWDIN